MRRSIRTVRERFESPAGIAEARKDLAVALGEKARRRQAEMKELRARIASSEGKIANLVAALAAGERSEAIASGLSVLEKSVAAERRALEELDRLAARPIALPTHDDLLQHFLELEKRLVQDPVVGREQLKRYFADGKIRLDLPEGAAGDYRAKWDLEAVYLLLDAQRPAVSGGPLYVGSSGGATGEFPETRLRLHGAIPRW